MKRRQRGYFDRKALNPKAYYKRTFGNQISKTALDGWIKVKCIFHDDATPSLGVNLSNGAFNCFACGAKGDQLKFHMKKYHLPFMAAVKELGAWKNA